LETIPERGLVKYSTEPLSTAISEATISGKREGINRCPHFLSASMTASLATIGFFKKSASKKSVNRQKKILFILIFLSLDVPRVILYHSLS
jgi:hypothetical protein